MASMVGLGRSLSAPSFSAPRKRRAGGDGGASGVTRLVEGTLFVAKSDEKGGPPEWEPFHFAHHADGAISFRPVGGVAPRRAALPSGLAALPSSSEEELYLDADWRQPFIAAPWKPLSRGIDSSQGARASKPKVEGNIFPFTLSYTPFQSKPGDTEPGMMRRMTVVLAATNPAIRSKWLASFSQKAHSHDLRPSEPPGPASMAPAMGLSSAQVDFPAAARLSLSSALRPPRRRFAALGDEHFGLPMDAARSSRAPRQPRLAAGPAGLWDMSSHLRVVRDLYDGYASDPLAAAPRVGGRTSSDSASDTVSGSSTPSQRSGHRAKFLEKYIERQAEIENLLERKWGRRGEASWLPSGHSESEAAETSTDMPEEAPTAPATSASRDIGVEDFVLLRRPALAAKTKNIVLDGDLLSNKQWSGGALLAPPDERSFRLTICALDPLDTKPLFIGIAPADVDLGMVNFFSNEGVFLCMGGRASDSLISALGAPAGPAFYTHGERHPAHLRTPLPGQSLSVHFYMSQGHGMVRFIISESTGEEVCSAEPDLKEALSTGPWRPCVLLCMPDTRVLIQKLI